MSLDPTRLGDYEMNRFQLLAVSFCFFLAGGTAHAGPNAGGTLIIHATSEIEWTDDIPSLCGLAEIPDGDCANAIINLAGGSTLPSVWWIVAAFPDGSSPRLAGVTFGVDYDDTAITLVSYESCGGFELHDEDWPAPGAGTAVTWATAQTDQLVTVYAFAGYEYYGADVAFCVGQPSQRNANFADDSIPSLLDPVVDFGCLGFNGDPGYLACPGALPIGACCFGHICNLLSEADCSEDGDVWYPDTSCDPNPCVPVPTRGSSWGRIKDRYR